MSQVRIMSIPLVVEVNIQSLFGYKENIVISKATCTSIRVLLNRKRSTSDLKISSFKSNFPVDTYTNSLSVSH